MQVPEPLIPEKCSPIKTWAIDDRPREKLILKGPEALSNAELLCILLRDGTRHRSAVDLAREVLKEYGNLQNLARQTVHDLLHLHLKGFGKAKASAIVAALELGRRQAAELPPEKPIFKDCKAAAEFLQNLVGHYPNELFAVLYLDQSNGLKFFERDASKGGIAATYVDPRLIFKKALQLEAVNIIVGHNHPSGNLRPSRADETLTARLKDGANYLDIKLLDHIIVSPKGYFSFAAEGLL
ncbi:MAG TPA: DNA repair protein RadC [Puia sp.]|nr:DNA repair protein RadC [Puia sp.]